MLTGATHGIGEAVARGLCPLVDVLVLHGLEPETEAQRSLDELRRLSPETEVVYLSADYGRLGDVGALVAAVRERVDGLKL
jgi:NAD(P)-dependent dehydrogenase (short-subunit alcohol dehydrogenase family)